MLMISLLTWTEPILTSSKEENLLVFLKYIKIHLFNMLYLNPVYLAAFLFGLRTSALFNRSWFSIPISIQAMTLELQVCSYHLKIGQGQLNIAVIM